MLDTLISVTVIIVIIMIMIVIVSKINGWRASYSLNRLELSWGMPHLTSL